MKHSDSFSSIQDVDGHVLGEVVEGDLLHSNKTTGSRYGGPHQLDRCMIQLFRTDCMHLKRRMEASIELLLIRE